MGRHANRRSGLPHAMGSPAGGDRDAVRSPRKRGVPKARVVGVATAIVLLAVLVAPSVAGRFALGCQESVSLRVAADPSFAPVVSDEAADLAGSTRRVDGRCVEVDVQAVRPSVVAGALSRRAAPPSVRPHVWIPDSSTWVSLTRTSPAGAGRVSPENLSVARSPVVIAMPRQAAEAAGWPDEEPGWGALLGAATGAVSTPTGLPDPTTSATGLTSLVTLDGLAAAQKRTWTATDRAVLVMGVRRAVDADEEDVRLMLDKGVAAFPATEQGVWAVNSRAGAAQLVAGYPAEGAPAADYPFAILRAPWVSHATRVAAEHLRDRLAGVGTRALLSRHGLRAPSGRAGGFATDRLGLSPEVPRRVPNPDGRVLAETLALWKAAGQHGRVLAAVDVSGSMGFPVPRTDSTRMEVARAAGAEVVRLFDRRSKLGVWVFSTRLDGDRDYRQVLPVGPLNERVGRRTRLDVVTGELSRLQPIVGGGTGLYDTALAAFREANAAYEPGVLNVVVLLTDGVNDDPGSISREQLLSAVHEEFDPERPVVFFTFGYGTRADAAVLADLAEVTGGRFYLSRDPTSIKAAFLDALLDSAELATPR